MLSRCPAVGADPLITRGDEFCLSDVLPASSDVHPSPETLRWNIDRSRATLRLRVFDYRFQTTTVHGANGLVIEIKSCVHSGTKSRLLR